MVSTITIAETPSTVRASRDSVTTTTQEVTYITVTGIPTGGLLRFGYEFAKFVNEEIEGFSAYEDLQVRIHGKMELIRRRQSIDKMERWIRQWIAHHASVG